jgi:hypothetical protein
VSVLTWTSSAALLPAKPDPVGGTGRRDGVITMYSSPTALRFGAQGSRPIGVAENQARSVRNFGVDLGIAVVS